MVLANTLVARVWVAVAMLLGLLMFACGSPEERRGEEMTGVVRQAVVGAETKRFSVALPASVFVGDAAAAGSKTVRLADRSRIVLANGSSLGPVFNSGLVTGGTTELGVEARSGTIRSKPAVTLRDRARVEGDVQSGGSVTRQNQTVVTGTVSANSSPAFDRWSWTVNFPAATQNVSVPADGTAAIAPGSFENVTVFSRATLRLRTGTYYLKSFALEPQAQILVDTTQGPVYLYVRSGLTWRGSTNFTGPSDRLLVGYAGSDSIAVESPFFATLVAPDANVRLAVGATSHLGAFFAKELQLDPDVRLTFRPFAGWDDITFDVTPTFQCAGTMPNGARFANFGYENPNRRPVTMPVGTDNRFNPDTANRGQPTTFLPGKHPYAFAVAWINFVPSWSLFGSSVSANPNVACPQTVTVGSPIADATVKSGAEKQNFGSTTTLAVSATDSSLVRFDRSQVRSALGQRAIRAARVELTLASGSDLAAAQLRPMMRAWTEGGATWRCANDTDSSASSESCKAFDEWSFLPREGTWDNPWRRRGRGGTPNTGTRAGQVVTFDVTEDMGRFLGPDGAAEAIAWAITGSASGSSLFVSREGASPARLVLEPVSFTDAHFNDPDAVPLSFSVATVDHPRHALPAIGSSGARSIAAILPSSGLVAEFAENEMLVLTDDAAQLAAIKARWGATELDATKVKVPGLARPHLLRVDLSRAKVETLVPNILQRTPGMRGAQQVSSQGALQLLAILADEVGRGSPVMANWVLSSTALGIGAFADQNLTDGAPDADLASRTTSSSNQYDYPYWGPGMHDLLPAWEQVFHFFATRDPNKFAIPDKNVDVTIIDKGYSSDYLDNSGQTWNCAGSDCESILEGDAKRWHGTQVANSGFAEPGNGRATGGPGHPVSDVTLVWAPADFWSLTVEMAVAIATGQEIVSISQSIPLPDAAFLVGGTITAEVAEAFTLTARAAGVLTFASASNDGTDIEKRRCFVVYEPVTELVAGFFGSSTPLKTTVCPWEETWWFPCENGGVNCVDASTATTRGLASWSNYGSSVAYRGVGEIAGTPEPGHPSNPSNHYIQGTSFSTPIVAGIAALTWSVDRTQSAGDVEECLSNTSVGDSFVVASTAVACAHQPSGGYKPLVQIVSPVDGASFDNAPFGPNLNAIAWDPVFGKIDYPISWSTDVEGPVGQSAYGQNLLYPVTGTGLRTITATVTNGNSLTGQDQVSVSFTPAPPLVKVVWPRSNGLKFIQNLPVDIQAVVSNRFVFTCSSVSWDAQHENSDFFFDQPGCQRQESFHLLGEYTLTATYADSNGVGSGQRQLVVYNDGKPHVKITSPVVNAAFGGASALLDRDVPITLTGTGVPLGTSFTYTWLVQYDDTSTEVLSPGGASQPWTPTASGCSARTGKLTLTGTDPAGHMASDTIDITINDECEPK